MPAFERGADDQAGTHGREGRSNGDGGIEPPVNRTMRAAFFIIACALFAARLDAEERFLLAADTQVIEINRAGRVTDLWKHAGHDGIYDAWRLPDGGMAYAHRGGLAVCDVAKKLVMEHASRPGSKGTESNRNLSSGT